MTPERWRQVDAILRGALACEPERREHFLREACGDDETLAREVASLLAAHDGMTNGFLEQPAIDAFSLTGEATPNERATLALAEAHGGRYAIERELARGGMATVYLARDLRHDRQVAIKVMRDEVAAVVGAARFLEEIRVTALLQHPHILPLFDSGSVAGLLWYAMPFVDGETLRSRLTRDRQLTVEEAVRIAREVADALEHAHAKGVVHRDVKPENILLHDGHALVADFGIALALEHAGGERLTKTGLTIGTPQYMSPEQAAGERAIDARVDVYALGAVLYEMLAGDPPFAAESQQAVLLRILHEPPAALSLVRANIPAAVDSAVRRALAKRPDQRFATAAAFAAALVVPERDEAAPVTAQIDEKLREIRSSRRVVTLRAAVCGVAAGIALGIVSGFALARWPAAAPEKSRDIAAKPWRSDASGRANLAGAVVRGTSNDGLSFVIVDRSGRLQRSIDATRPWTPRFSPDGRRVAYGAFGAGRGTSDLWVADLSAGTTQRLTDDDGDSNDPQWSPDGSEIAYSVSAPGGKDIVVRPLAGGAARVLMARPGTQFPSDWPHKGGALIVTEDGPRQRDILVQPVDGSAPGVYAATGADETAARVSPDGHWIAYTSDESGQPEVYLDAYPRSKHRVLISRGGGIHPVWRGDGRELYYWRADSLIAVQLGTAVDGEPPAVASENSLFRAPYEGGLNTMYDASPDGERFVVVMRSERRTAQLR
jgi:hypothetical protein